MILISISSGGHVNSKRNVMKVLQVLQTPAPERKSIVGESHLEPNRQHTLFDNCQNYSLIS